VDRPPGTSAGPSKMRPAERSQPTPASKPAGQDPSVAAAGARRPHNGGANHATVRTLQKIAAATGHVEKLVPTSTWSTARLALYSLVLGLVCYLIYALLDAALICKWPPSMDLLKSLTDNNPLDFAEIFWATVTAPFVGLGVSLALNRHWLNRFAKVIGVSNKFGDIDVWARTFNSDLTDAWVVVRDFDHDLSFEGWVNAFSETYDVNELLLRDVRVYQSSTAAFLYAVDSIYLTRAKDELSIEFRRGEPQSRTGGKANAQQPADTFQAH